MNTRVTPPAAALPDHFAPGVLFARIFRNSPTAMAVTAPKSGLYVDVNDAYARLLGTTREQLIGRPNRDVPLPAQTGHDPAGQTCTLTTATGETRHIIASTHLESWQGEQYHITLVQDLTAIHRTQDALGAAESRLRLFFSNLPLPVLVFDVESLRILDANNAAVTLYGYSREELSAMTMLDIRPPELEQTFLGVLHSLPETVSSVGTWRHRRKDGRIIDVEIVTYGMELDGRRARLSVLQDVTEQMALQDGLRANEERLRFLAELVNDITWDFDVIADTIEVKRGMRELLGYDPVDFPATEWWAERTHPEDWPGLRDSVRGTLAGNDNTWSRQFRIRKASGEYIYVYSRGYIMRDAQGQAQRMIGAMIDINRQIEIQEAIARAAQEERLSLARDLHDAVTQSLYSLSLMVEAARRHARMGDRKATNDYITRLGELAQQALKEMRLLIYGMQPSVLERQGLAGALQARLDAVERHAGIRAGLRVEMNHELAPATQLQLYRVAEEALNNALKHAAATVVRIHLRSGDAGVLLEISDNGRGFDPQAVRHAGGLGLTGMRERVERLGGQLELDSAPGRGATIRITLDTMDGDHEQSSNNDPDLR